MSLSLYDLLKRDVKKMVTGVGRHEQGNIYPLIMDEVERYIIELVLQETNGNHLLTSRILGISRSTLYRRIDHLKIQISKTSHSPSDI